MRPAILLWPCWVIAQEARDDLYARAAVSQNALVRPRTTTVASVRHPLAVPIEAVTGRIVITFAYPFGGHDDTAVDIVEETGYRAVVTCEAQLVRPGTDPMRLPRVAVGRRDVPGFAERLRAQFDSARSTVVT